MSPDELEKWQDRVTDLQVSFGNGVGMLTVLAGHNPVIVSREETLELFTAFEAAYGPLAEDQAAGRFWMSGGGILSPELRARITRLGALLRLPPESTDAKDAAPEIRALAEECLRMLPSKAAPPGKPSEPT
ncbi:MAG: hypothetical protein ACMG6S_25105 [Byssovorax sp.]